MPSSNSNWLPQSASECTVSASIALEPVKNAATPFATAIAKLAPSANRIARVESPPPAMLVSFQLRIQKTGASLASAHARPCGGSGHYRNHELRRRADACCG